MASYEFPRYCGRCGEIFDGAASVCPECGGEWPRELPSDRLACYAVLLTEAQELRHRGEITEAMFLVLRRIYEARLIAVRPARKPRPAVVAAPVLPRPVAAFAASRPVAAIPASVTHSAPTVSRAMPARPAASPPRNLPPPPPPAPPRDYTRDLRNWAARRQADLVLYLGAFLLSVSALIFVSYQGSGMSGIAKSGMFGLYTALFLVLGLQLRKWKRVQEAGPIFLAIGAILAPLNFVALYTNVLQNEDVAQQFVWLAGSAGTAALYFLLASRGFGRFYWIPGGVAAFAAYASLGACLELPLEWYGPWFLGAAVAANFFAHRQPPVLRRYIEAGAFVLGIPALLYTFPMSAVEGAHEVAPAVALALATLCLARSAFPSGRTAFLLPIPIVAVASVSAFAWSIDAWSETVVAWTPVSLLAVAAGYVGLARIKPSMAEPWAVLSLVFGIFAITFAHLAVLDGDIALRLPVAYGLAALVAAGWFGERRYAAALALVPVLVAAGAASLLHAMGALEFEWLGSFAAAAGLAYVAIGRARLAEARYWRILAGAAASLALVISHVAAGTPEVHRWELTAVYALVALGATFDALRFRPSAVVAVFALAIGGAAALWAFDARFVYWALPALTISLGIAASERYWRRDETLRLLAWPSVVVLAASPLLLSSAYFETPWIGALSFALSGLSLFALSLRSGGTFAALAGFTSTRAATIERQMFARFAGWSLMAAGGFVNLALGLSPVEGAWTYAGAGFACWLAVALLRGRVSSLEDVLGPVGFTSIIVAVVAASSDYADASMILGSASLFAAVAIGGRKPLIWRLVAASAGLLAVAFAHAQADLVGVEAWQVPAAYGMLLLALLWDSARNRYQPAMLFVPPVATATAIAAAWWLEWPVEHWAWGPLVFAFALVAGEKLWSRGELLSKFAWPYALVLGLAPVAFVTEYKDSAWIGAAAFALGGLAWAGVCLRSNGSLAAVFGRRNKTAALLESQFIAFGAFALGLAAIGHANLALGLSPAHGAWALAGATFVAWAAIIGLRSRLPRLEEVLAPASLAGVVVAVFASYPAHGHTAMILGVTAVSAALATTGKYANAWRLAYGLAGAFAVLFGQNHADVVSVEAWQLPSAYGLVLAALLWDSAWNRYQPAMLGVPLVAAAAATAAAWWLEWPIQHMAWAPLGIALGIAASERLWMRGALVRKGAWPYVVVLSLTPFGLLEAYQRESWEGALAFFLAATGWGAAAWRSNGAIASLFELRTPDASRGERQTLALGAFALAMVSLGHANLAAGVPVETAAWTFAAVGAAAILATAWREPRLREWRSVLTIAGSAATAVGLGSAYGHSGELAAMFGLSAVVFLASGWFNRSSTRVVTSAALAVVGAAFLWEWADWPMHSYALALSASAGVLFFALADQRKRGTTMRGAVTILSVAPIVIGVAVAGLATMLRDIGECLGCANPNQSALVNSAEWPVMAAAIALSGVMLVFEGLYRKGRPMAVAGTLVMLFAVELFIAVLQSDNIQAYTVPVALYLLGLGLATRRSGPLFGRHMDLHEVLFVLGAAVLVFPPAEQSFAPGGGNWALLVIVEGLLLLGIGLALFQRWLAVAGVVTLVAVAGRFVIDSSENGHIPYWAMLGAAGLALLGVGVFMLLERDWWDRSKARLAAWWLEGEAPDETVASQS